MGVVLRCRHVESRAASEKANRFQGEAKHLHRHDRPILWPNDMVGSKGIPYDDVDPLQGAVLLHVGWQPIPAPLLVRVVPGSIALSWVVRGDPQVTAHKAPSLPLRRPFVEEGKRIRPWHELVSDGAANAIAFVGIDDLPVTGRAGLDRPLRLAFRGKQRFTRSPGVPAWVIWPPRER